MAQRHPEFDVVTSHVTATGAPCAGDRVTIPIEQVVLDQRRCLVEANAVTQAIVLAVVDVMPVALDEVNGSVRKRGDHAVVDRYTRMLNHDAGRRGELPVILVIPAAQ